MCPCPLAQAHTECLTTDLSTWSKRDSQHEALYKDVECQHDVTPHNLTIENAIRELSVRLTPALQCNIDIIFTSGSASVVINFRALRERALH